MNNETVILVVIGLILVVAVIQAIQLGGFINTLKGVQLNPATTGAAAAAAPAPSPASPAAIPQAPNIGGGGMVGGC